MSQGYNFLHSHSGLEREIKYPKHKVLVDEEYEDMLTDGTLKNQIKFSRVKLNNVTYIELPVSLFIKNGGIFKNLSV